MRDIQGLATLWNGALLAPCKILESAWNIIFGRLKAPLRTGFRFINHLGAYPNNSPYVMTEYS
jgi:hypothetical protein